MTSTYNIHIEETENTPLIDFDHGRGELVLSGKSDPVNATWIYQPLLDWAQDYIKAPCQVTNLRLNLRYANSSTALWISKIIKVLCKIRKEDHVLLIHKYFDLEDFEDSNSAEIKDFVTSLADNIGKTSFNIGIKAYNTGENGRILRESTILI